MVQYQMIMRKLKWSLIRDLSTVALSVVIAIGLVQTGAAHRILELPEDLKLVSAFFGGMFFVSIFTAAPAGIVLAELAETTNPFVLALVAGTGNVLGDLLLFTFFKQRLEPDAAEVIKRTPFRKIYRALQRNKFLHWLAVILGACIVASPFPDEIGIGLMGASRLSRRAFLPLIFFIDITGIFLLALAVRAL